MAEITSNQIQSYFSAEEAKHFKGIPLLDPKVNWNDLSNWPDNFIFQGQSYNIEFLDCSGGDYFRKLDSRAEVKPGMIILAHYRKTGTDDWTGLSPSCYWDSHGCIVDKILDFKTKRVFFYRFYPTGALYFFYRNDFKTKEYRFEYFTRDGKLAGVRTSAGGKEPANCTWQGIEVDRETFSKRAGELFNNDK